MKILPLIAIALASTIPLPARADTATLPAPRERLSLDRGWRFHLGDIPFPIVTGHEASYANAKAGKAWGAAAPDYDASLWRQLDLPHDWAVEGPFDQNANSAQGYRPRGIGWYRRQFKLDPSDRGRHLELQLDGIATDCEVWFNGTVVARNWCGYTSLYIDITPFAQWGGSVNTIAIRVDADAQEGWWYEGAGIYRHTWLVKRNPVHIITDGIYANPVRNAAGAWSVPVQATLDNSGAAPATVDVTATLFDPEGREVASRSTRATVNPFDDIVAEATVPVASPALWSVDHPTLYTVRTTVSGGGAILDETSTLCGFRTIRFDADKGFFLNEQPLKIKGVCDHQDHAGVGVAIPDSIWDFRLHKLKEMGVNAYRCAHNPPAAEFLAACDRIGVMVMDENRNFNCSPDYLRQLSWMVRRDRNHPSVILWSVFNEEPMQGTGQGYEMVRRMAHAVKALDTTRPVTAAMSGGHSAPVNVSQAVDVVGFNYNQNQYDKFHAAHPHQPMTSSEDTSAYMTRGDYVSDESRHIRDSYDDQAAPWGETHRDAWKQIASRPFVAGGFVWTGFDYRGEPTPYEWPSAGSFFGCMDLCGFAKAAFYIHQAQWIDNRPILNLIPHWNWPGREGGPIKVMAFTNAPTVELFLNGKSLGRKAADPYAGVSWDVPYAPGRLDAVATRNGLEVARASVETTGRPAALKLIPDRPSLAGDGWDAQPVTVEAVDDQGRLVPTADLPVDFTITGPAAIIGLGNGDPNCHEPEKGLQHTLFNGLGQIIVRSLPGASGPVIITVSAPGVNACQSIVQVAAAPVPPFVAP